MGLKHLKLPTATIEVSDGESFSVRGLNLTDIVTIVGAHAPVLNDLFGRLTMSNGEFSLDDTTGMLTQMAGIAPQAAAGIIATAADEDDASIAANLPFSVQIDALEQIMRLTFSSEGGAKKVLETVVRVLNGTRAQIESLKA